MAKKQKYYVVWAGNETGVFDSWAECQLQIKGYPGARYKSFPTRAAAEAAYHDGASEHIQYGKSKKPDLRLLDLAEAPIEWESIAVDAACSGNPGDMEYRGVDTKTGDEIFRVGPYRKGTNNVGEFLALVHALAYLKKHGKKDTPIYSDSKIAMGWVERKVIKTKLKRVAANEPLFDLIGRGITWLENNPYSNRILKWNTREWGEIPADFGRK